MSNASKIMIGTLTLLPWVTMAIFFVFVLGTIQGGGHDPELFKMVMGLHFAGVLSSLAMIVFYVVHVLRYNERIVEQNTKLLWALMIFFGNIMATPIYFWMYILPEGEEVAVERPTMDPRDGLV